MEIDNILQSIRAGKINVTQHAREEAKNDRLILDEILYSTGHGEIIKNYPEDRPYQVV
jgi:hypothetical protein